jgi:nicotinate-nucleotide pyrophosphorylase (carboxylating)
MVARAPGVIAGLAAAPEIVRLFAPQCTLTLLAKDGQAVTKGAKLATLRGPVRQILAAERTLLNLVGRLSGIATRTREFVRTMHAGPKLDKSIRGSLFDTRKTTPGLRVLEKYAVRCGGGACHRIGLHDAVLIKDNHIAGVTDRELPSAVAKAAAKARSTWPGRLRFIEVEVDTLDQFKALLTLPSGTINIVLLDNMPPPMLRKAVVLRDKLQPSLELEASGGITLQTVRKIAETGVDRLSVGSLTHGAVSLDVALDMRS